MFSMEDRAAHSLHASLETWLTGCDFRMTLIYKYSHLQLIKKGKFFPLARVSSFAFRKKK